MQGKRYKNTVLILTLIENLLHTIILITLRKVYLFQAEYHSSVNFI